MKNRYITLIAGAVMAAGLVSCQPGDIRYESQEDLQSLMDADKKVSEQSGKDGYMKAMLANVADSAVLLRPGHMPLKGAAIKDFLASEQDSLFTLTWSPDRAAVAASGEMGYTYGTYTLRIKKDGSIHRGTYATIWQREKKEGWKMMLDTGNPSDATAADTSAPAPAQPK